MAHRKHNNPPPDNVEEDSYYDGVTFTRGPMHINHFYEVSKCGVNALRLYQYIRTIQGLKYKGKEENSHLPIKVDNKKLYKWFGVGPTKKWEALNKLANKIIKSSIWVKLKKLSIESNSLLNLFLLKSITAGSKKPTDSP